MRIYIDGTFSTLQKTFLPEALWFANLSCEDTDYVQENCICLEGHEIESSIAEDGMSFSCRWKGVDLCRCDEGGERYDTEDWTIEEFMQLVNEKGMKLVNMDAYLDCDTKVTITELTIVDGDDKVIFNNDLIQTVEFLGI